MKVYNTTFVQEEDYCKILLTKTTDQEFLKEILIDNEFKEVLITALLSVDKKNYVKLKGKQYLHHLITDFTFTSFEDGVIDHINGNPLDNRRCNLRKLSHADNSSHRTKNSRSNTEVIGIARRTNGKYEYFRATVSDRTTKIESKAPSQTKRYSKQFNINKLGEEEAMTQAKAWLKQRRAEFGYVDH
jgi:hypothetical protein